MLNQTRVKEYKRIGNNLYEVTEEGLVQVIRSLHDQGYISFEQLLEVEQRYKAMKDKSALT